MMKAKRSTTVTSGIWRLNILSDNDGATYLEVLQHGNVAASINTTYNLMEANSACVPFLDECLSESVLHDDEETLAYRLREASLS